MNQAILYGLIGGFSVLAGAAAGIYLKFQPKTIARFMAFGSGVLICALTFGLMEEAFGHGGFDAVIIGFISGGLIFILADYYIHKKGGRRHKRYQVIESGSGSNGKIITMGAILDGLPESVALGISIFNGQGRGILMLIAIALSNFPEGISSITGLKKEGYNNKKIMLIWLTVAVLSLVVTAFSYAFLTGIDLNIIGFLEAFAAGAILAMLADSMIPEAYQEGGFLIGALTVLGFLAAFVVSRF